MFLQMELLCVLFNGADAVLSTVVKSFIKIKIRESMTADTNSSATAFSSTHLVHDNGSTHIISHSLGSTPDIQDLNYSLATVETINAIQRQITLYQTVNRMCMYIPSYIITFACGAWSDRHGNKLPMLLSCIGIVLSVSVYLLLQYILTAHLVPLLIVAVLCRGLTGKTGLFTMAMSSLVSRTVPARQQSARFSSMMAAIYMGQFLGSLSGGVVQDTLGIIPGMLMSSLLAIVSAVVILISVGNSAACKDVGPVKEERWKKKSTLLKSILRCCCCRRKTKQRFCRWEDDVPLLPSTCRHCLDYSTEDDKRILLLSTDIVCDDDASFCGETEKNYGGADAMLMPAKCEETEPLVENKETEIDLDKEVQSLADFSHGSPGKNDDSNDKTMLSVGNDGQLWRRRCVICASMFVLLVLTSLRSSQMELILITSMTAPLSWPASWYGYLSAVYYLSVVLCLRLMIPCQERLLPHGSFGDCVVLLVAVLSSSVSAIWTALAYTSAFSAPQIFMACMLGALGLMCQSTLRTIVNSCVSQNRSGKMMGMMSVFENVARVVGPVVHSALYATTLSISPVISYYVIFGESLLVVPFVLGIYYTDKSLKGGSE